jgi:hypothetical protein
MYPRGQRPRHQCVQPIIVNEQGAIADERYESYSESRTIMIAEGCLPVPKPPCFLLKLYPSCPTHLHRGGRIEHAVTQVHELIHIGDRFSLT